MKKLVLFVFLFATFQAFGQFPNYTNINGRYKWIAGKFDSTFTIPSGTSPSLRTGGGTGPGAMFYRTTDSTIYQYTGTQWLKLRGAEGVTSVGLTMPSAFSVTGSPVTGSGTLGVTGAGTVSQYIRGDGSLSDFPSVSGGGGGKVYFFNGGILKGTFGGITMYQLGDTAVNGTAANFTRSTTGNIANFITDTLKPFLTSIPAGTWTIDAYMGETGGGSNHAELYAILEKWNGSTITTIATSPVVQIVEGSFPTYYAFNISVPVTSLAVTDRIIIQFYIQNTNGKTVTLYTQNGKIAEVHTTLTTGVGSLNGLTAPTQYFATGTSGTDFAISSSTATHTFNLPTASAYSRGALSSADWTTFNGKVGGSGTTNYVSKFTASGTIGNSQIFDNGTNVGIGTASPSYKLDIIGDIRSSTGTYLTSATAGTAQGFANNGIGLVTFGLNTSGNALVVNDIDGAKFAFGTGGFNTTLYKHRSTDNKYYPTFVIKGSGATSYGTGFDFYVGTSIAATITSNGRLLLGTTTESTYILDVNGTTRISGTELRLDNGTTGVINLYSATPEIRFAAGDPTGYRFYRSGTGMFWNSGGGINLQISGNDAYNISAANGHIFRTANSGSAGLMRLDTGGSLSIGKGTTAAVSSSILELSSTTKGFLPPVMTGAQAEAIATPATGLMVYANNGNGATITSTGWWGYNGTTWVKLN